MTLPAQDIVERLRDRAKRMNGALVGASDGGTYALGYYDQFAAADDREAADTISRLTADNEAERAAMDVTQRRAIAAEARADALAQEVERLSRPITMQDVRLAVGEGKLRTIDVLNGANAELRRRAALANEEAGG